MKNGFEIWGNFIKTGDNNTTERIKKLQYQMNQVLYDNNKRYISPLAAERILKRLIELGVSLKELNVDSKYQRKKEAILSELRRICKSIIAYKKSFCWREDDLIQVNNTLKYQVKQYIDEKDTLDVLKYLKRNKEIWEEIYEPFPFKEKIDTKHFVEMQAELQQKSIEQFNKKYGFSA